MNTPATQQFSTYLKQAGVNTDPTYSEYNGYASMILLVQGLQGAGSKPTQASLVQALSGIHSFDAGGLFGDHPVDINNRTDYAGACEWITKLQGQSFQLVPGADPICGNVIAGKTVSPAA
jgi:hypothetical protein